MNIKNFQSQSWHDLFSRKLSELMEAESFSLNGIQVNYSPVNATDFLKTIVDSSSTNSEVLNMRITFSDESSSATVTAPLITLPIFNEDGIMINNTKWALINTTHPASGWYILRNPSNMRLILVLQRGAKRVLEFDMFSAEVIISGRSHGARRAEKEKMPLFTFLKAVSCSSGCDFKTISDILSDCPNIMNAYVDKYINSNNETRKREPDLIECVNTLLYKLTGNSDTYKWDDPIGELHKSLSGRLRIGEERIPRFRRFCSFARARGTKLVRSVTLKDGRVIPSGEALTESVIRLLDSDDSVVEISVEYNDRYMILQKYTPSQEITFDEIVCALRIYDQAIEGLLLLDDPDELYNKVVHSIREDYEDKIENAISKFTRLIREQISNSGTPDLVMHLSNINYAPLQQKLEDVYAQITSAQYYQQFDETNSLAGFDQGYKLTTTASNVAASARDIHPMQYGRICPYTTSESKQVGLNLALTLMSELDQYGFIVTPIHKFADGVLASDITYISAIDEITEVIAPASVDLAELWRHHGDDKSYVVSDCRVNGQIVLAHLSDITAQYVTSIQTIGPLPACAPASNMDSPKRLVMCASAQRQALVPLMTERPNVTTGVEGVFEIGVTTAKTVITDYLTSHGKESELHENARLYYSSSSVNEKGDLFVTLLVRNGSNIYKTTKFFGQCHSTINGAFRYLRIAPPKYKDSEGRFYELDDVVYYNSDIDLAESKFNKDTVKIGAVEYPSSLLASRGVAIGNNCKVLFKSFDGDTYEDSIEVTESFLERRGLSVVKTTSLRFTLRKDRDERVEFYKLRSGNLPQIDENTGFPKTGYYVQAGQDILSIVGKNGSGEPRYRTEKVGVGQSGFVISHKVFNKNGDTVVAIDLGDILDVNHGDKLEGLHGNKGVVGRILRDDEVAYTEDGEIPDVILNPLGLVARLNIGQVLEFTLGSIAEETGEIQVLEPFSNVSMEEAAERAKALGLVEKDIYDGRTGLKYAKKAMFGNMYMLRLEHTDTSKYNATSDCRSNISARTGQPQSGKGGGQRISELCTWCLKSYNADAALDTLFTVQSDAMAKRALDTSIRANEKTNTEYTSGNIDFLQAYFHLFGAHIAADSSNIRVELLTQKYIDEIAPVKCNMRLCCSGAITPQVMLHSEDVFGGERDEKTSHTRYGQLPFSQNNSCKMIMPIYLKSSNVCGMFRYISEKSLEEVDVLSVDALRESHNFKTNKLTPQVVNDIINGDSCIIGWTNELKTADVVYDAVLSEYNIELPDSYRYPVIAKTYASSTNVSTGAKSRLRNRNITDEQLLSGTGIAAIVNLFETYNPMYSICRPTKKFNSTDFSNKELYPNLADIVLFTQSYSLTDFIVTSMLIPPVGYRAISHTDTKMSNPIDAKLIDVVSCLKKLYSTQDLYAASGNFEIKRAETELYKTLKRISFGGDTGKEDATNPSLMSQLSDHKTKSSILRDTLLSKRVAYSGRSVITVGSKLRLGQCGVPICMLTTIFESHIAASISKNTERFMVNFIGQTINCRTASYYKRVSVFLANNNIRGFQDFTIGRMTLAGEEALRYLSENYKGPNGESYSFDSVLSLFDFCYEQLMDLLAKFLKQHPVLLGREPSLHKFSVQGFKSKIIEGHALQLHPLNCHGYNGDFDGDQMMLVIPMHDTAKQTIEAKMMSENNLIDPKDGTGIVALNQDIILGLYYATIHRNNAINYNPNEKLCAIYVLPEFTGFSSDDDVAIGVCDEVAQDVFAGMIDVHDTILCVYQGRKYIAEAGRFLVASLLPNALGFTTVNVPNHLGYSDTFKLAIDKVLSKKTIGEIERIGIDYFSTQCSMGKDQFGDSLGEFYNRFMTLGFKMADLSGISLSIYDLAGLPVKKLISDDMSSVEAQEIENNDWFNLGMCTEQERDDNNILLWQDATRGWKGKLANEFKSGDSFDRMSNIFMIVDSGARGDVPQLLSMAGVIGVVTNSSGKAMATPVRKSYMDGLTPEQFMQNSYTGRRQVAAAQLTTATAGEFTRRCIYLNEHQRIRNEDERCDAEAVWIDLEYDIEVSAEHYADRIVLDPDEIAKIPIKVWESLDGAPVMFPEQLGVVYSEKCEKIRSLCQETIYSEDLGHLMDLMNMNFYVTCDPSREYHLIPIIYHLSRKSRDMLSHRVLGIEALRSEGMGSYGYVWAKHGANFVGDRPAYLGEDVVIGDTLLHDFEVARINRVPIFTILGCKCTTGICKCCFGVKYDTMAFPALNEYVGYQAVQAIGNPITQLILDSHKVEVSGEESEKSRLDSILENEHRYVKDPSVDILKTMPIAASDSVVSVERAVDGKGGTRAGYTVRLSGETEQEIDIKSLAELKCAPGTIVKRGRATCSISPSYYGVWMNYTDIINVQVDVWKRFCACFKNETVLSRNFEVFAKSLTEFGCADKTDLKKGVIKGSIYRIALLNDGNIPYTPVFLALRAAMDAAGKVLAGIALSNAGERIAASVTLSTDNLSCSDIGSALIGYYSTSLKMKMPSVHSVKQEAVSDQSVIPQYPEITSMTEEPKPEGPKSEEPEHPLAQEPKSEELKHPLTHEPEHTVTNSQEMDEESTEDICDGLFGDTKSHKPEHKEDTTDSSAKGNNHKDADSTKYFND